ncbi:MAG: hypothetical protein SFX72_15535 [Isosphaeraceae bacterium]|nr:hypothetical protein [Isosphaeraceae bacterium]
MRLLANWRSIVLALLFAGPFLVYVGFGLLWLRRFGWWGPTIAGLVWMVTGVAFSILASRWTKRGGQVLPYLDEHAPETFSPLDEVAWRVVRQEAESVDALEASSLIEFDRYVDTAKRLALELGKVYKPDAENPLDHVPLLEALTALELALGDVSRLTREIPGADLVTPGHVKAAVQAAGYIRKAGEWYGYVLPFINPATGLPRMAGQELVVKPAWRDMQQNGMRWFYRAFIYRLGLHLIELLSGRLVVGAENYRRLMREHGIVDTAEEIGVDPPAVVVAGSQFARPERWIEATLADDDDSRRLLAEKFEEAGIAAEMSDRIARADWSACEYLAADGPESRRERSRRGKAVEDASEADLLILAVDDRAEGRRCDIAFLTAWNEWYSNHRSFKRPPVVVVVSNADEIRAKALRSSLPEWVDAVVALDCDDFLPVDRLLALLPTIGSVWPAVERAATIRRFSEEGERSKAGRLIRQVARRGREMIWGSPRRPASKPGAPSGRSPE